MTATETPIDADARRFLDAPKRLLIGGEWVEAASGETFSALDPATGETLAELPAGSAADVDAAVGAARQAFDDGWATLNPTARSQLLWSVADTIEAHAEELAVLESLDTGKPVAMARQIDVPSTAAWFRYWAGWPTKIEGATVPLSIPFGEWHAYTRREPVGVVAAITPWNFPLLYNAWKAAPPLACGNTVVLKPAEDTSLTTLRIGELMLEAGIPAGVFNVVTGDGPSAGAPLAAHPGVDKVGFTGSAETGRLIVDAARGNLKRVSLELGGKSPNIVFADADLEQAIPGAANAIFFNQGEVCTAGSLLYVERSVFDQVVEGVCAQAAGIRLGPGLDPETQMGPLVSAQHLDKVSGLVASGVAGGGRAATGGKRPDGRGYFYEPTVLVDAGAELDVVREEVFGPVVVAIPFDDVDEIAAVANNTRFGLAAGFWTRDLSRAHRLAARLKAGNVYVNCFNMVDVALPFGGYKESGWGRDLGKDAIDLYTETKSVVMAL